MADVTNRIPGSRTEVVDVDETITIGRSRSATVQRDDHETVIASKTLSVGRKLTLQIADEIVVGQARLLLKKDGTILISR